MNSRYKRNSVKSGQLKLSARRKANRGGNLAEWRKRQNEIKLISPERNLPIIEESFIISGRRVVDIKHFIYELQELNKHSPIGCTLSDMEIVSEKKNGLISGIKMKCKMCNYSKVVWTENPQNPSMNANTAAVTGIMSIGGGFSNMEGFFSTLNIPSMTVNSFIKEHEKISDGWEITAQKEMELAVSEEKRLAIQRGDVDSEGIPLLTVVVDGSWAKRSYKTNFASLSGAAAIAGLETKKVLFIGVRNKYCVICARAARKQLQPGEHKCFKNWVGSSSAMEADIIVEGFSESVEMYGVKYARFIGDGDSNVYKKILDSRPYVNLTVEKIECKNHLLHNMCNKLKDIARNRKLDTSI